MFKAKNLVLGSFILLISVAFADDEDWENLARAARTGQLLNLSGHFVRQTDEDIDAFTLYRLRAKGEVIERRIADDGIARELIRTRQSIRFYTAHIEDMMYAKMDGTHLFPGNLPLDTDVLKHSYHLSKLPHGRVAGADCHWVRLTPKDDWRYIQEFCLDHYSLLPLAQIYKTHSGMTAEANFFTRFSLTPPKRHLVNPNPELQAQDQIILPPPLDHKRVKKGRINDTYIQSLPASYFILSRKTLSTKNKQNPIHHYVIGDGLVSVSLFIEDNFQRQETLPPMGVIDGALSIGIHHYGPIRMVAIGNMPPQGIKQLLENITLHNPSK